MCVTIPFSPACERNKEPIASVLGVFLEQIESVLEIGSGTGQHAIHFASLFPHLIWQSSDQSQYVEGVAAQIQNAQVANAQAPFILDVTQSPWIEPEQHFDAVYTANTLHIMSWPEVELFFEGLPSVVNDKAYLMIYGPFKFDGDFSSASNAAFDRRLRTCGQGYKPGSAIRDFEEIDQLAQSVGFQLVKNQSMPANNQCIIWQCEKQTK